MFPLCPCRRSNLLWMRPEKDEPASSSLTGCPPSRLLTSSRSCLAVPSLKKARAMTSWPRRVPIINWYWRVRLLAKGPQLCERAGFHFIVLLLGHLQTQIMILRIFLFHVQIRNFETYPFPGFSTDAGALLLCTHKTFVHVWLICLFTCWSFSGLSFLVKEVVVI